MGTNIGRHIESSCLYVSYRPTHDRVVLSVGILPLPLLTFLKLHHPEFQVLLEPPEQLSPSSTATCQPLLFDIRYLQHNPISDCCVRDASCSIGEPHIPLRSDTLVRLLTVVLFGAKKSVTRSFPVCRGVSKAAAVSASSSSADFMKPAMRDPNTPSPDWVRTRHHVTSRQTHAKRVEMGAHGKRTGSIRAGGSRRNNMGK